MKTEAHETTCALLRPPLFAVHVMRHRRPRFSDARRSLGRRSVSYARARITHIDRAIIRAYYQRQAAVPRICRWDGALESQPREPLHVNQVLPLTARCVRLPDDLERLLSTLSPRFERLIVDNDIVLVETRTRLVFDVVHNFYSTC